MTPARRTSGSDAAYTWGGMSIDPEEFRDQIIAAREEYKHLVHRPKG